MYHIQSSSAFRAICPQFAGRAIYAEITNSETSPELWAEIEEEVARLRQHYTTESIKHRTGIAATRAAYKAAGKDPSRYRPACEQLARRVLQGKSLYAVNTVVDLVNLASLFSGYSTAALNADCIEGDNIELDLGQANEPYEGIGRGILNIENLPVYRDRTGGFATPTSDSVRTMLQLDTTHLLVLINGYDGDEHNLEETVALTVSLLQRYAHCQAYEVIAYA